MSTTMQNSSATARRQGTPGAAAPQDGVSDAHLWRLVGDGLAACYVGAEKREIRLLPDAVLALSGEPVADLNYVVIPAGPLPNERLRSFMAAAGSLPLVVLVHPEIAPDVTDTACAHGLQQVGTLPLMTCASINAGPAAAVCTMSRVADAASLGEAMWVMARAFGLAEEPLKRAFTPQTLLAPGLEIYLARQEEEPVGAVMATQFGAAVGLWAMATVPDHQRQGVGRALLQHVMAAYWERGASFFYLGATEAGYPLYQRLGFQTTVEAVVWVAGHSTQAPG